MGLCHPGIQPGFEQIITLVREKSILFVVTQVKELDVFPAGRLVQQIYSGGNRAGRRTERNLIPVVIFAPWPGITILA